MGNLTAVHRLYHLTQARCFVRLTAILRLIRKIGEHRPTDRRANSIAADNEVASRGRPIFEVQRNRASGRVVVLV